MTEPHRTETLADLKLVIGDQLKEIGLAADVSDQYSAILTDKISLHFGGRQLYIAMPKAFSISARDKAIAQEFNGRNVGELCRKYSISEQWLYKIIKRNRPQKPL